MLIGKLRHKTLQDLVMHAVERFEVSIGPLQGLIHPPLLGNR